VSDDVSIVAMAHDDLTPALLAQIAHLHVNLAPAFRNRGLGARLIEAFAARAAAAGAQGVHVVTARSARNVRFYLRCGFAELGASPWNGREAVFLARALGERGPPTIGLISR
jgi:GNAT superfamily N-acetyltransferase